MRVIHLGGLGLIPALLLWSAIPARAQTPDSAAVLADSASRPVADTASSRALSRPDSAPRAVASAPRRRVASRAASASIRRAARRAVSRRIVISVEDRRLWWMDGGDTLYTAPIAVGTGEWLEYAGKMWNFATPISIRTVIRKGKNPVWTPPDWHYAELARDSSFTLIPLQRGRSTPLADGSQLRVQGQRIVHVRVDGTRETIPADEEIVFGDTLFMPPLGTVNRRIEGELGAYKLDMGNGYLIHGTPHKTSIGTAASHGCIRVGDEDLEYLYKNVPIGVPVYIY